ncbi:MAG: hypothetical protein M1444_00475 [Patescibacteria group bacterium]|nr:hypothetical protein [Patescibacteria group bacterium]
MVMTETELRVDQTSVEEAQVTHSVIAELEEPITNIIGDILRNGKTYDLIVGDDTSGRIPTLILGKALNRIRENRGQKPVPIRFVSGDLVAVELAPVIGKLDNHPNRALLVTDYLSTGKTLGRFASFFTLGDIDFDVATLTILYSEEYYSDLINEDSTLYIGRKGDHPQIWGKPMLTGFYSHVGAKERAIRYASTSESLRQARADVAILADRISRKFV